MTFRTVYFRPRLALDWKIPVAVLVKTPQGLTRLQADVIPDPRCLGSVASHCVLKFGLDKVATTNDWHELPPSVGPHFELGEPRPMPDVADPIAWVKSRALPDRASDDGEKLLGPPQDQVDGVESSLRLARVTLRREESEARQNRGGGVGSGEHQHHPLCAGERQSATSRADLAQPVSREHGGKDLHAVQHLSL